MLSSDQGVYIPELGRRISSINQLTHHHYASLSDDQLINVFSYMGNHPTVMGFGLTHRGGRRQPFEEESSTFDQDRADQEITSEVWNAPADQLNRLEKVVQRRVPSEVMLMDAEHGSKRGTHSEGEKTSSCLTRNLRWTGLHQG